jgi:hypothetical protein
MSLLQTIGRMLLGGAIRRAMWRSPKALLIVAALVGIALLSIGNARAQNPTGNGPGNYDTRANAVAACKTYAASLPGWQFPAGTQTRCQYQGDAWNGYGIEYFSASERWTFHQGYWRWITGCPANAPWDEATGQCVQSCTSRPDTTTNRPPFSPAGMGSPSQFTQCSGGCPVTYQNMQDGTYVGVHTSNAACNTPGLPNTETCNAMGLESGPWGCVPPAQECTAGQVKDPVTGECKGSNCPAGMNVDALGGCKPDAPTCPPGQIKAPDGSCLAGDGQCAAGEARGKDGTCKRDSDGDGTPDSEQGEGNENGEDADGNSFSGGDNCTNPPACSGNPILCGQARIQWRIECNTRTKVNISGGTCGAIPQCSGENCNLMEYNQLVQQWKTACALEKMAQGTPNSSNGQPDWTKVDGMGTDAGAGETSGDTAGAKEIEIGPDVIKGRSLTGGGSSCPSLGLSPGSGMAAGFISAINQPPSWWCTWIGVMKAILIVMTSIYCVYQVARGG